MRDEAAIREAEPEDADAISALVASLGSFFLADPDDVEAAAPYFDTTTPDAIRSYIAGGRFIYHVAESGSELVGTVGVRDASHLYQRCGLAARLWEQSKQTARAAGNPGRFTVNSSLYAVSVYERFGFVATGPEVRKDGLAFLPMVLDERAPS